MEQLQGFHLSLASLSSMLIFFLFNSFLSSFVKDFFIFLFTLMEIEKEKAELFSV